MKKTTKQKIKAARKGKVLANSELNEWMGTNRLNLSKHSRENELETDSLGIIFHLNAGFTPEAASSALQLLEGIDQAKYSLPNLESFFDFASYPWQARWGKSSLKGLSLHKPEQEEDERLRTHPDLTRRIEQAQRMVSSKSHFVGNNDLCTWHDLLEIDLLKYQYKERSYFFTLLQSLKILGQNPKHRYAKAIVAHCLIDLCLTRKRHEFSKIVPAPNIKMDNDIFRLVTFLDNLSYSELKQVATHWGKAVLPVIKEEEIANGLTLKLEALSMDFIELPIAKEFKQNWPEVYITDFNKNIIMNQLLKVFLFGLLILAGKNLWAQSKDFEDITSVSLRNMGTITEEGEVTGYYMFYQTDRGRKGSFNYELQVLDSELNVVMTKKISRDPSFGLSDALSNGNTVLFKFWDSENKKLKLKAYDLQGETVISKTIGFKNRIEMSMYDRAVGAYNTYGTFSVSGYGFLEYLPKKYERMSYQLKYLPLDENIEGWTLKGSKEKAESATFICRLDTVLINLVNSRPKALTVLDTRFIIEGIGINTGERLFSTDLMAAGYNVQIINGTVGLEGKNILLYGLYYSEDKVITSKSEGLIKLVLNDQGEVIADYKLSWKDDFKVDNEVEDNEDFGNLFFHQFVNGKDGSTYIIGEQYGLNAGMTALSFALNSRGGAAYKINDLIILELDKDFRLRKMETIEKSQNSYMAGKIPLATSARIGMMIDYYGWFDFSYLQNQEEPGDFILGYVNFEKKKGSKNSLIFGGVTHRDDEYIYDKISLSTKGKEVRVFKAKTGYVCLVEYVKKTKSLSYRLEKINF